MPPDLAAIARLPRKDRERLYVLLSERARRDAERSLYEFVKLMWPVVEPATPFMDSWVIGAQCDHLQAVTEGHIQNLLINECPGFAKSLIGNVFWPAFEWGPRKRPHERYVTASYSQGLTVRDNRRFREVVQSPVYRRNWGDAVSLDSDNIELVLNSKTGWKLATSVGGRGTGERGSRVLIDDPNSVKEAESDTIREETNRWFREVVPSRLNDQQRDSIVVIQQRTHENDVSGTILSSGMEFEHLLIPMEWDGRRYHTSIGWTDPRDDDGELAWPERFPTPVVAKLKNALGPYAYAGQYQQVATPRGGGIIQDEWWMPWDREGSDGRVLYPPCEMVVASLDTAYTEKTENDYSAVTVWGVWRDAGVKLNYHGQLLDHFPQPKLMLLGAWRDRLALHPKLPFDESEFAESNNRAAWERTGLVERVAATCRRMKVDVLLIENKAAGISVSQEIRRLYRDASWRTVLFDPSRLGDKVNRLHAIVPIFSQGLVYAPAMDWAQMVQDEVRAFPRGAHDDLVDTVAQALRWMRDNGIILRLDERGSEVEAYVASQKPAQPLYPA